MAGIEDSAEQAGAVKQVHLADARHVHDGKQFLQLKLGTGLFVGLTGSAFGGGFAQFHETGRQRPHAAAGLDVALAQQHLLAGLAPYRHRANYVERVFVVNGVAGGANGALACVAIVGQAVSHGGAAFTAMFQWLALHGFSVAGSAFVCPLGHAAGDL